MADMYLVNGADITALANAIRAKSGTSDPLKFTSGMIRAIEAISSEDFISVVEKTGTSVNLPEGATKIGD